MDQRAELPPPFPPPALISIPESGVRSGRGASSVGFFGFPITWDEGFGHLQQVGAQSYDIWVMGWGNVTPSLKIACQGSVALPGHTSPQSLFLQPQQWEDALGHGDRGRT